MIGKVTRGSDIGGLLRYLYGPGKANEHTNPHLVASWRGDDRLALDQLEPPAGRSRQRFAHLADRLSLPVQLLPDVKDKYVWQCSMRLADSDRRLTDPEWAQVAREVVETTGFAPTNDPGGCRWVAIRHADDHIHIAVVLARQDGHPLNTFRDWPKVHAAARAIEKKFGLTTVPSPDRSASVAPSRGEVEKAGRRGAREPVRTWLAREVRTAAAGSTSREEFEQILLRRRDVVIGWRESQRNPGEVTGFKVGRVGDIDAQGHQVWFSGSKLAPDLSLPKLNDRWREVTAAARQHRPDDSDLTNAKRHAILENAEAALLRACSDPVRPWAMVSAGEVATSLAQVVEGTDGGPLSDASDEFARTARQSRGRRPDASLVVHDLRSVASDLYLLGRIMPNEAGQVLLIVGNLARIAATIARNRPQGESDPRRLASRRAVHHFARHAGPVREAQIIQLRSALSRDLAADVLADPAWPALAAQMRRLGAAGTEPSRAVSLALRSREIVTATSIARVLHYRLGSSGFGPSQQSPKRGKTPRPHRSLTTRTRKTAH
jgi:hypothetical protein